MAKKKQPKTKVSKKKVISQKVSEKKETFERKMFYPGFWNRNLIAGIIIFIVGLGLYLRAIPYEYVLDDQIVITKNIYTEKGFGGIWDILTTESFQGYFQAQKDLVAGARYRPLSIVTFAIEYGIVGGFNRQVSHFINALLYGLCGLLLFRVLALMFDKKEKYIWYLSLGFWAALLWVVHPLHTEAVANIKGRDEIMSLIGALAAMYYSFRYIEKNNLLSLVLACVSFFLGLLSKETPLTFLGVIPLTIYFFQTGSIKRIAKVFLPLVGVIVIYLIIRVQVIGYLLDSGKEITDLMNNPFVNMNGGQKYATVFYTLLLYLKLLIVPYPLTHDYYPFHIPTFEWNQFLPILSLVLYIAIGVLGLLGIKKRNVISYGFLFYIMTLSIVSNIFFPIGTFMNERFLFMPSVGMCIVMAYILIDWLPRLSPAIKPIYAAALLGVLTLAYGFRTFNRIPAWRSPLSLNASAIKVSKNSARANIFMGTALYNQYQEISDPAVKNDVLTQAEYYVRRSKELYPKYHNANLMLAGIVAEKFKIDGNFDQLLLEFENIAKDRPDTQYLFEFYDYLKGRPNFTSKLADHFYKVGKQILIDQQYNYGAGLKYLKLGEEIAPNDQRILQAIADTYQKIGDTNSAQVYLNKMQ